MTKSNSRALKNLPSSQGRNSRSQGAGSRNGESEGFTNEIISEERARVSASSPVSSQAIALKAVQIGTPGPFQIIDTESISELDHPAEGPRRRYDCRNYETCLNLAAALNWDNFTCRGCSGCINESLMWRAQHQVLRDPMAKALCDLPDAKMRKIEGETTSPKTGVSGLPPDGGTKR